MKNVLKIISKYFYLIVVLLLLHLFYYMSIRTPLAGDDWGFFLIGDDSPINKVFEFYSNFSGRSFSVLWEFYMATHKEIWNYVNPFIFSLLYLCIYNLSDKKNKPIFTSLLLYFLIVSVFVLIRTQTYTWVTGGIYSSSLCLSLMYFSIVDKALKEKNVRILTRLLLIISNIFLFIGGMMMENISGAMVFGTILITAYAVFKKRKDLTPFLIVNDLFSISSFLLMRLSPGSHNRLLRDHYDWCQLSLFKKIISGYHSFLENSFINNTYLIAILSLTLIGLIWLKRNNRPLLEKNMFSLILFTSIICVFSKTLISRELIINNPYSIFSMLYWPFYTITCFAILFLYLENGYKKDKTVFFLLVGGVSAVAMMLSPINGARSYIYIVYYVILVIMILINSYEINDYVVITMIIIISILNCKKTNYLKWFYDEIAISQKEREKIIQYYIEHPEDEDVWIERFPENSIHSIDIEDGDTYHFEVFKGYFGLPQNSNNITFYKKNN